MTKQDIERMVIPHNWVLMRMIDSEREIKFGEGTMYVDPTFEIQDHVPRRGEVIKAPQRLIYGKGKTNAMDWKTKVQIRPGDIVYFEYLAAVMAFGRHYNIVLSKDKTEEMYWEVDGEMYFMVPYSSCFCAKVRGYVPDAWNPVRTSDKYTAFGLNGYCLVEPQYGYQQESDVITLQRNKSKRVGRVYLAGIPNEEYANKKYCDATVKAGDVVIIHKVANLDLESKYRLTFDGDKTFYVLQGRYVEADLNGVECVLR